MDGEPLVQRWGIGEPLFALTFDDGPSPWTDAICEHLRAYDATATFFVIGSVLRDEERSAIVRRVVAGGHEIGNHGFTHLRLTAMRPEEVEDEIVRTNAAISDCAGVTPRFWRPPYLESTAEISAAVAALGLLEARASIVTADYEWPATRTATFVLERLRPGDIVDLHDGRPPLEGAGQSDPDRLETVAAVGLMLAGAEARGLQSVSLSRLYPPTERS